MPEVSSTQTAGWRSFAIPPLHGLLAVDDALMADVTGAAEGGLEEVLDVLSRGGIRRMADFVLVLAPDDAAGQVVCRGTAYAVLTGAQGEREVRTGPRGPWTEVDLDDDVTAIRLESGIAAEPAQPTAAADVVAAVSGGGWKTPSRFARRPAAIAGSPAGAVNASATSAAPAPAPVVADPATETPAEPSAAPAPAPAPTPTPMEAAAPTPVPAPVPEPPIPPMPSMPPGPTPEQDELPSYDHLFGITAHAVPTQIERIDDPAQAEEQHDDPPATTAKGPSSALSSELTMPPPPEESLPVPPRPATPTAPAGPAAPAVPGGGTLIASVPWATAGSAATPPSSPPLGAAPPVAPPFVVAAPPPAVESAPVLQPPPPAGASAPAADDGVELTVDRRSLATPEPEGGAGPLVLSVLCPAGHASSPHSTTCRTCGRDIPPQQAFMSPRPRLGVLRLSTGDVVSLDRGVLFGRAPKVNADIPAAQRPHLVKLPSPDKDISRNHVEVFIDGWHVLVRDLGSVNGTTVTLPGEQPLRLRPSDQQGIEPGTDVTIADAVSFTYEVST